MRGINLILHLLQMVEVHMLPAGELKKLLKTTVFLDVRNIIWKKLGNIALEGAYINNNITLIDTNDLKPNIILGKRVALAPGVTFITCSSPNNSILASSGNTQQYCRQGKIIIGDDSWIGANSVIQPGVEIGKCCIIGSMSNVTHNIPDFSLAYGNPARVVKRIEL